jgi:hypothetical protein
MPWLKHPYRHTASEMEDLSYPPSGGRVKLVLLGILLPALILHTGLTAWFSEEAVWFGQGNSDIEVKGATAKSLGVVYSCVGLFCHFRWCWGLVPVYRVYHTGTVVSLLGIITGMAFAAWHAFF